MPLDCTFRFADKSDTDRVTRFVNAAYHGQQASLGWTPETHLHAGPRTTVDEVARHIADPNARVIL